MADNEKLLEAARMIQEHCKNTKQGGICPFAHGGACDGLDNCRISGGSGLIPGYEWDVPKPRRWTDADVNMAKILVSLGYKKVMKFSDEKQPIARDDEMGAWHLDSGIFAAIEGREVVQLSDIIAEGAEQ